jgi:hypothetical protein
MRFNTEVRNLSVRQRIESTKTLLRQSAEALQKGDEFLHGLALQKRPTGSFERHNKKMKQRGTERREPARPNAGNGEKKDLLKRACELVRESQELKRELAFLQRRQRAIRRG